MKTLLEVQNETLKTNKNKIDSKFFLEYKYELNNRNRIVISKKTEYLDLIDLTSDIEFNYITESQDSRSFIPNPSEPGFKPGFLFKIRKIIFTSSMFQLFRILAALFFCYAIRLWDVNR